MRKLSNIDRLLDLSQNAISTVMVNAVAEKPYPSDHNKNKPKLSLKEKNISASYMRVNHVGEVCAQALYHSQAMFCRNPDIVANMIESAQDETNHLAWCQRRLQELDSSPSKLLPLWYSGAFAIGSVASLFGDRWNLGFVAETEKQVVHHLETHLKKLPEKDTKSRAIVKQMQEDEARHAQHALDNGGAELPKTIKVIMKGGAKVMTSISYWI